MKGKKLKSKTIHSWLAKAIAFATVFVTAYSLILPAFTLSAAETYCAIEEHIHSEDCDPECQIEVHEHTLQCFSNPEADVEDPSMWTAMFADSSQAQSMRSKVVETALAQEGYAASLDNYFVDEQENKIGYTRYGDWDGNPYESDWNMSLIRFCLFYSGIGLDQIGNTSAAQALASLKEQDAVNYLAELAQTGDVLFLNDGEQIKAGIITSIEDEAVSVVTVNENKVAKEIVSLQNLSDLGFFQIQSAEESESSEPELMSEPESLSEPNEANEIIPEAEQTDAESVQTQETDTVDPVQPEDQPLEGCGFTADFPVDDKHLVGWQLEYKQPNDNSWKTYDPSVVLKHNTQLRIKVNYKNLTKEEIQKANEGKFCFALPSFLNSTESNEGSELKHTKKINQTDTSEFILGHLQHCNMANHVHVNLSGYGQLDTEGVATGEFYLNCSSNLEELSKDPNPTVTIGGTSVTLKYEDRILEKNAPLSVNKKKSSTEPIKLRDDGLVEVPFTMELVTGQYDVPDVVVDDYITYNFELADKYLADSITLTQVRKNSQPTGNTPVKVVGNEEFAFASNLWPDKDLANKPDYIIKDWTYNSSPKATGNNGKTLFNLEYTDHNNNKKTHRFLSYHNGGDYQFNNETVGFSAYLGTLEANSTYELDYTLLVNPDILNGGSRAIRNYGQAYCSELYRQADYEDVPLKAELEVAKSQVEASQDVNGDVLIKYSVSISAKDINLYPFKNSVLKDSVKMQNYMGGQSLAGYTGSFSWEGITVTYDPANGETTTKEFVPSAADISESAADKSKTIAIPIGDENQKLFPGDKATVTYTFRANKEVMNKLAVDNLNGGNLFNSAYVRATTTINGSAEQYTYESHTNTAFDKSEWMSKNADGSITAADQTVDMTGSPVYGLDGQPDNVTSFNIPKGSIRYSIALNEDGINDFTESTFTDELSVDNEPTELYTYSGYLKVDVSAGIPSEERQVIKTFWVKLPQTGKFSFSPKNYKDLLDELRKTENLTDEEQFSYKLSYYVAPADPKNAPSVILGNNISADLTVGVGGGQYSTIKSESKVTNWTATDTSISAKKTAVMIHEPEVPIPGYQAGQIIWLVEIDTRSVPKGMTITDVLAPNGSYTNFVDENSLLGVYISDTDFNSGALAGVGGFGQLWNKGNAVKGIDEKEIIAELSKGKIVPPEEYDVVVKNGSAADIFATNHFARQRLDVTFKKSQVIPQGSKMYLLMASARWPGDTTAFLTADHPVRNYENDVIYSLNGGEQTKLVHHSFQQSPYNRLKKMWNSDFVYEQNEEGKLELNVFDRNNANDASTWSDPEKLKTFLNSFIPDDQKQTHAIYSDWRIIANRNYSGISNFIEGEVVITETLPTNSSFVGAYVTRERDGQIKTIDIPEKLDSAVVNETGTQVRLAISGVVKGQEFTVHVITRDNCDWNEIVANPGPTAGQESNYNHRVTNRADLYYNDEYVGASQAPRDLQIQGVLSKTGPSPNSGSKTMPFSITLNEKELDLIPNSDRIDLVDTFDPTVVKVDQSTISVQDKDGSAIDGCWISFEDVDATHRTMTINNLPDGKKIVINYDMIFQGKPGEKKNVSNSVTWKGTGETTPQRTWSKDYTYNAGGTSSSEVNETVRILKYDKRNAMVHLPGVEFELYSYSWNAGTGEWDQSPVLGTYSTGTEDNQKGRVVITEFADGTKLSANVLYSLVEKHNPNKGYVVENKPNFFYFELNNTGYVRPNLPEGTLVVDYREEAILNIANSKEECTLKINKSFSTGSLIPGNYLFAVYTKPYEKGDAYLQSAVLTIAPGEEGSSKEIVFKHLDKDQTYYVYEMNPTTDEPLNDGKKFVLNGQEFEVEYPENWSSGLNAEDDEDGVLELNIVNRSYYALPKTGGIGKELIMSIGFGFMLAGAALYSLDKNRRSK